MRAALALCLSGAVLLASVPAGARCAMAGMRLGRIGSGALSTAAPSFVLGMQVQVGDRDVEQPGTLGLVASGATHPLSIETLAPGLLRVHAAALSAGRYTVAGLARSIVVDVGTGAASSALPAPQVTSITTTRGGRGGSTSRAQLAAPIPAGAVAVIVSDASSAVAWSAIEPRMIGTTDLVVATEGRCTSEPPGYRTPSTGTSVTLRYLDATGAMSPPSRAITVQ